MPIGDGNDDDVRIEHTDGFHTDQLEGKTAVGETLDGAKTRLGGHAKIDGGARLAGSRAAHLLSFDPFEFDFGGASAVACAPEAEVGKAQPLPLAMNRWSVRAALALALRHVAEGKGLPQGDRRAGITQYESTQRRQPTASPHRATSYIRGMHALLVALALTLSHSPTDSLAQVIRARIAQVPGAQVGLAFRRLDGTDSLYLDADTEFHAASTMKVPVMIELFRQIDHDSLSLDKPILVENQFKSIVDSSAYTLDPGDDSDSSMYKLVGTRVSVRDLMDHMIERSSNLATNTLIALAGADRTTAFMRQLGATHTHVLRGVEDDKAFQRGLNNMISARDLATILDAIQTNRAASAASCAMMRDILLHQEFSAEIPAGLPPGTPVAHKTGWITGHLHDAAIVYPREAPAYILVVLTRGIPDENVARSLIVDISRAVYAHVAASASSATTGSR